MRIDKSFDFEIIRNIKLVDCHCNINKDVYIGGTYAKEVTLFWENGYMMIFLVDGIIDDLQFKNKVDKVLVDYYQPRPNYATITVGWMFSDNNEIYFNVIGKIKWGKYIE